MSTDTDDLPDIDMDRPLPVTFGKKLICPDLDETDSLSTPPRRYTTANSLA